MKNKYEIRGDEIIIFLNHSNSVFECTIDIPTLNKLKEINCTWRALKTKTGTYYVYSKIKNKYIYLHRLILNTPDGLETDHINRNTLDNRTINLRVATRKQNVNNTGLRKGSKSGYKGIHWCDSRKRWVATIKKDNIQVYSRTFKDLEQAKKAHETELTRLESLQNK